MLRKIAQEFRAAAPFGKTNEVGLFRALARAIVNNSTSTFIDETHGGNVCNVTFSSATGKTETCEIADLLILSVSPIDSELRATFWQAKKQATSKWLNATLSGSQLDFKGQFNQWDLLSRRPSLSGGGVFLPPGDLLSSFQSPSIGTFGVFFEKASVVEVAYSIAEFIACPSPASKHPTLSINGYLDKYWIAGGESIARSGLTPFLEALFNFQIGALLVPSVNAHRWLVQYVRSKSANVAGPEALRPMDDFLGPGMKSEHRGNSPSDGLSVLIIGHLNQT